MALLLGDIHGNLDKAKNFLAYKPEETHIFVGDYVDSFDASDVDILETLKLCIESNAILLWGNHDLHYLSEPPFMCSGFRHWMKKGLNEIFEEFITRFVPATVVDGFIVTHGGVTEALSNSLFKTKDPNLVLEKINTEWNDYLTTRFNRKPSAPRIPRKIFYIGVARGGMDKFSGIFWADYRSDKLANMNQIFGHSKTIAHEIYNLKSENPLHMFGNVAELYPPQPDKNSKTELWAIGCDNDRRICFNSTTREVESFG